MLDKKVSIEYHPISFNWKYYAYFELIPVYYSDTSKDLYPKLSLSFGPELQTSTFVNSDHYHYLKRC